MTSKMLWLLIGLFLSLLSTTSSAAVNVIPPQLLKLNDRLELEIHTRKSAFSSRGEFVLRASGKEIARVIDSQAVTVVHENRLSDQTWERWDIDGDGRPDWVIAFSDPHRAWTGGATGVTLSWPVSKGLEDGTTEELCKEFGAIIVSGDEQRLWVVNYSRPFRPLATSALGIMLPEQAKRIIGAPAEGAVLQSQPEISANMWKTIAGKLNTVCEAHRDTRKDYHFNLPPQLPARQHWGEPRWQDYLPSALKMYQNAQAAYRETIRDGGPAYRTSGASIFNFRAFFATFLFDEIDPERKYPLYTAMLNDHAYSVYLDDNGGLQRCVESLNDPKQFEELKRTDLHWSKLEKRPLRTDWSLGSICDAQLMHYQREIIPMLTHVIERDPNRAVAYLNLADAQWEVPDLKDAARTTYRRYIEVLRKTRPKAKPAKQALERAAKAL